MDWTTEERWLDSQQVQQILLLSKVSGLALGGTQPPTLWVPGVSSWAVKRPERKVDRLPFSREKAASCGGLVGTRTSVTKCQRSRSFSEFHKIRYRYELEFRENPVRKSNASLNNARGLTITEVFTDRSGF